MMLDGLTSLIGASGHKLKKGSRFTHQLEKREEWVGKEKIEYHHALRGQGR